LMDKLGIESADFVCWSMGTYVGQYIVTHVPSRVKRIVLAATDPGGPKYVEPYEFVEKILTSDVNTYVLFALSFPPDKEGIVAAAAYAETILAQSDLVPDSFTLSNIAQAGQLNAANLWKEANGSVWYQLPSVQPGSVMVANGDLDLLVKPLNDDYVAKQIPKTVHCVYPGTGHAFLFQEFQLFGDVSLAFLEYGTYPKVTSKKLRCSKS